MVIYLCPHSSKLLSGDSVTPPLFHIRSPNPTPFDQAYVAFDLCVDNDDIQILFTETSEYMVLALFTRWQQSPSDQDSPSNDHYY